MTSELESAAEPPTRVTVLTQPDCRLCEHAASVLDRVARDHLLAVETIGLDTEPGRELGVRHGVAFAPGVLLEGTLFSYGRLSERRLRRHLARAHSSTVSTPRRP